VLPRGAERFELPSREFNVASNAIFRSFNYPLECSCEERNLSIVYSIVYDCRNAENKNYLLKLLILTPRKRRGKWQLISHTQRKVKFGEMGIY